IAYTKRSERSAKGAHDHGCASHVPDNESVHERVIARTYETAATDVRQFRGTPRPGNFVNLGQANPLGRVPSRNHHGIGARCQVCYYSCCFRWITWREPILCNKRCADVRLPIVVAFYNLAGRVVHSENRVGKNTRKPEAAERWAQRADHYRLSTRPANDETVNQDIVAAHDCPAGRKILYSRLHRRKLGVFQVNGSRGVRHLTRSALVLVVKNRLDGRI